MRWGRDVTAKWLGYMETVRFVLCMKQLYTYHEKATAYSLEGIFDLSQSLQETSCRNKLSCFILKDSGWFQDLLLP